MYDDFSADYDRFVDWPARLEVELPLIEEQLRGGNVSRVLDAACGTGMHAIALARLGYDVTGVDQSAGMIARARENASAAEVDAHFRVAGFGQLTAVVGGGYDAVLCLGNSLPHVLTPNDLAAALIDFAACLQPGGLLLIQNRNFDAVMAQRERWMGPQSYREGDEEWLFFRFYDFEPGGMLIFNVVTLMRAGNTEWSQRATSTRLWPLQKDELMRALAVPFDPSTSGNLVVAARRQ
jgi:SAM-dependent methyltransferase